MVHESAVAVRIRTALAEHFKRDVAKVRLEDDLRKDLGLDSLAMIELLFKIEEAFDLEIPNDDLSQITTVGDVIVYVEQRLGAAPAVPAGRPAPTAKRAVQSPTPKVAAAAKRARTAGRAAPKRTAAKKKGSRPA